MISVSVTFILKFLQQSSPIPVYPNIWWNLGKKNPTKKTAAKEIFDREKKKILHICSNSLNAI